MPTLDLASNDVVADGPGAPAVNLAANTERSTQNLADGALEGLGEGLGPHLAGDVDDLVQGYRAGVLDVLDLLAVTGGLLQGLDDKGGGGVDDGDRSLTVLDRELDGDTEALLLVVKEIHR